jgi:hypothetical protein
MRTDAKDITACRARNNECVCMCRIVHEMNTTRYRPTVKLVSNILGEKTVRFYSVQAQTYTLTLLALRYKLFRFIQ